MTTSKKTAGSSHTVISTRLSRIEALLAEALRTTQTVLHHQPQNTNSAPTERPETPPSHALNSQALLPPRRLVASPENFSPSPGKRS